MDGNFLNLITRILVIDATKPIYITNGVTSTLCIELKTCTIKHRARLKAIKSGMSVSISKVVRLKNNALGLDRNIIVGNQINFYFAKFQIETKLLRYRIQHTY